MASSNGKAGETAKGAIKKWLWRDLDTTLDSAAALRDASSAPGSKEEYERRFHSNARGLNWARLIVVNVLGASSRHGFLQVQSTKSKEIFEVHSGAPLPWLEGLWVLDSSVQSSAKAAWLESYESVRTGLKRGMNVITYVETRLLDIAVTGSRFLDGQGVIHSHRRKGMCTDKPTKPAEGETLPENRYEVESLVDYMPPWDAVLHESCGLYQDYYLVKWGAPHDKANFSKTEEGSSNEIGCTWEPDECLPDDLDTERVEAKQQWIVKQKALSEALSERPVSGLKRPSQAEEEERIERISKMARTGRNKYGQRLFEDFSFPSMKHGWMGKPPSGKSEQDEVQMLHIKKGWPKDLASYPKGMRPACPPGPCNEACNCMEDWHLGFQALNAKEQDRDVMRCTRLQQSLDNFGASGLANPRGAVSRQFLFEARVLRPIPQDDRNVRLLELRRTIFDSMRDAALAVPLEVLVGNADASILTRELLLPGLTPAFSSSGSPPSQYLLQSAVPWLSIDAPSGELLVITSQVPELDASGKLPLTVQLLTRDGVSEESELMNCMIVNDDSKQTQLALGKLTAKVADAAWKALHGQPWNVKSALQACLAPIFDFDFDRWSAREASIGIWMSVMSEAALLASAATSRRKMTKSW